MGAVLLVYVFAIDLQPANSSWGGRSTEFFDCQKNWNFIVMASSLSVGTSMLELVLYLTLEIVSY